MENEKIMQKIGTLKAGQAFGELALLKDIPRTASIFWLEECHFAILDKEDYKEILGGFDD